MTRVRMEDARACGFCADGIRTYCTLVDVPLRDFVKNGVDADHLRSFNDANLERIIEEAQKRENQTWEAAERVEVQKPK